MVEAAKRNNIEVVIPKETSLGTLKPIKAEAQLKSKLESLRITFEDPIVDIEPLIGIQDGTHRNPLFSLGNISTGKGKAKSRKSFGVSLFLAALFSECEVFQDKLALNIPESRRGALWIDTEQAKPDLQRCLHRIPKLNNNAPSNLFVYQLRKAASIAERLKLTLEAIENHKDQICFVVIDGVADIVSDINDRPECIDVILKLMKLSDDFNIHIHIVLHENKQGTDARGHLGTECTNKSETVIQYQKCSIDPENTTIVKGEYTRGRGFKDFSFTIDLDGLPRINEVMIVRDKKAKITPTTYEPKEHLSILKHKSKIKLNEEYTRGDIITRIKDGFNIGRTKADSFLLHYLDEKYIERTGKPRSPNQRFKFIGHLLTFTTFTYDDL